jgi:hypothetical protein
MTMVQRGWAEAGSSHALNTIPKANSIGEKNEEIHQAQSKPLQGPQFERKTHETLHSPSIFMGFKLLTVELLDGFDGSEGLLDATVGR